MTAYINDPAALAAALKLSTDDAYRIERVEAYYHVKHGGVPVGAVPVRGLEGTDAWTMVAHRVLRHALRGEIGGDYFASLLAPAFSEHIRGQREDWTMDAKAVFAWAERQTARSVLELRSGT